MSAGSEQKARFSVPLIIFTNGFSHVYILISFMQVIISLVIRMRWSLTSEVWCWSFTVKWARIPCSQDARASFDKGKKAFLKEASDADGVPGFHPALFETTETKDQAPTEGFPMEAAPAIIP